MNSKKSQEENKNFLSDVIYTASDGGRSAVIIDDFSAWLPFDCNENVRDAEGHFQPLVYDRFNFGAGELVELLPASDSDFDSKKNSAFDFADVYSTILNAELKDDLKKRWVRRSRQLLNCNNFMQTSNGRIYRAFFCKTRLCPLCSWRRSIKIAMHTRAILSALMADCPDVDFIFLTLTVPNVSASELPGKLSQMFKAWDKMTASGRNLSDAKRFNSAILGYYRGLEITYNSKTDTYHPHFHCLLAVRSRYFKDDTYIKQSEWLAMWQRAMKDQTIKMVNVKKVKPNKKILSDSDFNAKLSPTEVKALAVISAVTEVTKYTVKTSDYIDLPKVTRVLDLALERRRLVAYGGLLADYHKKLNLDDEVEGDLLLTDAVTAPERDAVLKSYAFVVGCRHYVRVDIKRQQEKK